MIAETMDRLLVEDIAPEDLLGERVLDVVGSVAGHWQNSLRRFARVQARWLVELAEMGRVDAATRRSIIDPIPEDRRHVDEIIQWQCRQSGPSNVDYSLGDKSKWRWTWRRAR